MSYLSQEQTTQIGQLLRARVRVLRDEIRAGLLRSDAAHHKDLAGMVSDAGDEAAANMLADVDVSAIDRDVRELREVESALARIGADGFGACGDCGEPIGYPRLVANPAAVRCHACQGRRERGYAHQATPSL